MVNTHSASVTAEPLLSEAPAHSRNSKSSKVIQSKRTLSGGGTGNVCNTGQIFNGCPIAFYY